MRQIALAQELNASSADDGGDAGHFRRLTHRRSNVSSRASAATFKLTNRATNSSAHHSMTCMLRAFNTDNW